FTEDVATRFFGYGWNVTRVSDANDLDMLRRAFQRFHDNKDGPTLIIVDSHIGYGAPHKQDTSAAHGEPLGEDEIRLAKRNYGWPEDKKFTCQRAFTTTSVKASEHAARSCGMRGSVAYRNMAGFTPTLPTNFSACNTVSFRRVGTGTCPTSLPIRKVWGLASHREKC